MSNEVYKSSNKIFMPDGIGYVELLETFGNDLTVVNAARVSFDKVSVELTEVDKKLIRYLATHNHISPFFHPQARFRLKMPIFICREWFRHTVGLARNEVSRRYVDTPPECWIPDAMNIRERDPKVKQGSKATAVSQAEEVYLLMKDHTDTSLHTYQTLLEHGVAPEVARSVLPQGMFSEFIETGSLAAYARICQLRLDPTAQKEIRDYANAVCKCMNEQFPVSWKALIIHPN